MDQNSKGKIFFFGPGSQIKVEFPIRTSKTDDGGVNESGSKSDDVNNKNANTEQEEEEEGNNKKENVEMTSDEDGDELLKKIDAVLDSENGDHDVEGRNCFIKFFLNLI